MVERLPGSGTTISRSFASRFGTGLRPMHRTPFTAGSRRHSIRTPWPTIPVAPKMMTFMGRGSSERLSYCFGHQIVDVPLAIIAATDGGRWSEGEARVAMRGEWEARLAMRGEYEREGCVRERRSEFAWEWWEWAWESHGGSHSFTLPLNSH